MTNEMTAILFWASAALVFYTYVGYPALVWCLSRGSNRDTDAPAAGPDQLPTVSLLVAAWNEASVIEARIENALATDYPRDLLEIVIALDGSSDGTADVVRRYVNSGIRLVEYPQRRGKSSVLNATIPGLRGQIAVLSDANTALDPMAVRNLVAWFRNPRIGIVCGRLVLCDPRTGRNSDSLYWRYETFIKRCESRLGALLGSNGAIYAMRRELFTPIPEETVCDDFVIPLLAKQRTGCRIIYDYDAVAREQTAPDIASEFRRRTRIGAGDFQSIGILWPLLNPRHGPVAFSFLSHKVLRWLCPFFLLAMLASSLILCRHPFYRELLLSQIAIYVASAVVPLLPARMRIPKLLRLPTMFTSMNAALLVGFFRWLLVGQKPTWEHAARSNDDGAATRREGNGEGSGEGSGRRTFEDVRCS